jgi:L-alanine-DL-glutamate epimerase-like enolase superfamily enzyme
LKITRISLFAQDQPFRDGTYTCSGGRSAEGFESSIAKIETDAGITGWGEMAPLGSFYDPAFVGGARAGLAELAPALIGQDPAQVDAINQRMDLLLNGHPYAKAALDMACWDIKAKQAGIPLAETLGGRFGDRMALYRSVPQAAPEAMALRAKKYIAEGYRRLQVKVGLEVKDDIARMEAVLDAVPTGTVIFADANAAWRQQQALEFLRATRDLDYVLEQPCASYEANLAVRAHCDRPLVLDETIDGLSSFMRAWSDRLIDGITIKVTRVGGITKAKLIRDAAAGLGIGVTIEDTGGAEINTAVTAHLMLSTPESVRQHTCDFYNWVTSRHTRPGFADKAFDARGGSMTAPRGKGLGIEVEETALGAPFFAVGGS